MAKAQSYPRGPPVLKILRRANSAREVNFATEASKRYGEGSEVLVFFFSGEKRQENSTDTEKLRRWQYTTDSSAALFLVRKGPLGGKVTDGWVCESGCAGC